MPRPGNVRTAPKRVWLTEATRASVQAWADEHRISFSAALETLARVGLGQPPQEAVAPALVSLLRREVQQQFHRVAGLYAATAIEAGVASRLSGAALRRRNALRELGAPPEDGQTEHPHAHAVAFSDE